MLLDIFSGAGGLTEGFLRKNFDFVSHIEMNSDACNTLETRLFYHQLKMNNSLDEYYDYYLGNISKDELYQNNKDILVNIKDSVLNYEITTDNERSLIKTIEKKITDSNSKKVEGIIGGPPCQAYSTVGRARDSNCMKGDKRNYLYKHYIHFIKNFEPNFFIFENVPGMLTAQNKKIYHDFKNKLLSLDSGYKIEEKIVNAKSYDVLQARKRIIFIGHKYDGEFFENYTEKNPNYKVYDLLKDLPKLYPGEGNDSAQDYIQKNNEYLKKTNIRTHKDKVLNHIARKHNERDRQIYKKVIDVWNKNHRRIKYNELPKNLITHNNTKSFLDRFKIVAGDLNYSHTIMSHMSKDGHYYIHPDINQLRSLTVREAARIQSFPDNFKFEGSRTAQYVQVGNAVPPLMAESFAKRIKKLMG